MIGSSYKTHRRVVNTLARELRGMGLRKAVYHGVDVREVFVLGAGSLDVQDGLDHRRQNTPLETATQNVASNQGLSVC